MPPALPISRGLTFLLTRRRNTAEGGSTQRIPSDRCLPLRPSHLSRFKFSAGPKEKHRRGRKYAENTNRPLSSSATFPSLAVQIFCWPKGETPQREEVRREYRSTAVFLCDLPISRGSNFLLAQRRNTAEGGSTQRIPIDRCLPLRPSHLSRFKFSAGPKEKHRRGRKYAENTDRPLSSSATFPSLAVQIFCWPKGETPQREEVRREYRSTAVFLCDLPISRGSNFLLAQRRNTAEGGSTQRIPIDRCLPLRPSHLSRFKFSAGPKEKHRRGRKYAENTDRPLSSSATFPSLAVQIFCWPKGETPQREEVRREYRSTAVFLCDLPISRGSIFLLARRRNTAEGGSTQRIPIDRCLPLRPSHLSRLKFSHLTKRWRRPWSISQPTSNNYPRRWTQSHHN